MTWTAPGAAQLVLVDAENDVVVALGGWLQPRYEYASSPSGTPTNGFTLRRARLDLQGHVFTPRLTIRVQPEFAGTPNLRDGYLDYAFDPLFALRLGQFPVPFQWRVSPRRQQFAESGAAGGMFRHPTTRDVGLLLHGRRADERMSWGVGVFSGTGANSPRMPSTGHMISGRLHWSLFGPLPRQESDEGRSARTLSVGAGFLGAHANELEDWSLGRSPDGSRRADWVAGVVDAQWHHQGLTASTSLYRRAVHPFSPTEAPYDGWGAELAVGYAIVVDRMEVVGRLSQGIRDEKDPDTRERSWAVTSTWYFRGHSFKGRAQYAWKRGDQALGPDVVLRSLIVDTQILF